MAALQTIKVGDIIEVDKGGRRGLGLVQSKKRGEVRIDPITAGFTWRTAKATEVVKHWRRTKL